MKKAIAVLSVLALLVMSPKTVHAMKITENGSGATSVSYSIAPSYMVTIPADINLKNSRTAEITVTGAAAGTKPRLGYNRNIVVRLSNAQNGFSGSDGRTLSLKDGNSSLAYTLGGVSSKTGKGDILASFSCAPNKTLNDYKQALTFTLTSEPQYAGNYTDQLTFEISYNNPLDISKLTSAYQAQDGDILTGTGNADTHITIADGATVTLRNWDITAIESDSLHSWAGITLEGNGTLILEGTNKIKGGRSSYPGICVPVKKTLVINGSGSLEASSNGDGTGIGSGRQTKCGNITISGGKVTAIGGNRSAGIGSGWRSDCGDITISGGEVTAIGGNRSAGIGSGGENTICGDITISGGKVTASGGWYGAGIGGGSYFSICGDIAISGGEVTAVGGNRSAGIGCGGYESGCKNITISKTVIKVEATKGEYSSNSIGAGQNKICGTVTIEDDSKVIQK